MAGQVCHVSVCVCARAVQIRARVCVALTPQGAQSRTTRTLYLSIKIGLEQLGGVVRAAVTLTDDGVRFPGGRVLTVCTSPAPL